MADLANNNVEPPESARIPIPTPSSESQAPTATPSTILNLFDPCQPLADNDHDSLYLVPLQTWAQLNPNQGVQKHCPRAKATDAAKATRKITTAHNKANAALLSANINNLVELQ